MLFRRIGPIILLCTACVTYRTASLTRGKDENRSWQRLPCQIDVVGRINHDDMNLIRKISAQYASFRSEKSNASKGGISVRISDINPHHGASALSLFSGLSLTLIPSYEPYEKLYGVRLQWLSNHQEEIVAYEIYANMFLWLPVNIFGYWPESNEDRLAKQFIQIFDRYCRTKDS